jgi:hypothetical protein
LLSLRWFWLFESLQVHQVPVEVKFLSRPVDPAVVGSTYRQDVVIGAKASQTTLPILIKKGHSNAIPQHLQDS